MKISFVQKPTCHICLSNSIDEEYKKIIEKLLAIGIQPTGNKTADKAKLRQYEMQQLKIALGANGKGEVNKADYLTISAKEIETMKDNLKINAEEEKLVENINEDFTGRTKKAMLNRFFIEKKKIIEE
ncbi:hypothetical protein J6S88_00585 [bacterium]|nr:hypothetical protein [bacterium]